MKKILCVALIPFLSSISYSGNTADLSPKAAALNQKIEVLQKELQAQVEAFNAQVEQDAAGIPQEPIAEVSTSETAEVQPKPASSSIQLNPEKNDLQKRVEVLELEVQKLKKSKPTDLEGARTPEEAAATKKAEETAPILATNTPAVAQYNQALTLMKNNELEKAVAAFEQILKDYPSDPYAHKAQVHLGDIFKKLGKMDEAERAYVLALTYNLESPLMVECRLGLAEVSIALSKTKPACDQLSIIKKESLDSDQKKRLQDALSKVVCQK